jgi:hypothetical protein
MRPLKASTAATVIVGPFIDDTDFKTAETALTISQADVRLSKNGAAFAQKSETTSATHRENGHYAVALNTTDTNTLGLLDLVVAEAGALIVRETFVVLPAGAYDALVGTGTLAEPTATFAWPATPWAILAWIGALSRNKIQQDKLSAGGQQRLRNDADSGNISTATASDDGTTTTRGEWT